jgi:hypothetical protein
MSRIQGGTGIGIAIFLLVCQLLFVSEAQSDEQRSKPIISTAHIYRLVGTVDS